MLKRSKLFKTTQANEKGPKNPKNAKPKKKNQRKQIQIQIIKGGFHWLNLYFLNNRFAYRFVKGSRNEILGTNGLKFQKLNVQSDRPYIGRN